MSSLAKQCFWCFSGNIIPEKCFLHQDRHVTGWIPLFTLGKCTVPLRPIDISQFVWHICSHQLVESRGTMTHLTIWVFPPLSKLWQHSGGADGALCITAWPEHWILLFHRIVAYFKINTKSLLFFPSSSVSGRLSAMCWSTWTDLKVASCDVCVMMYDLMSCQRCIWMTYWPKHGNQSVPPCPVL